MWHTFFRLLVSGSSFSVSTSLCVFFLLLPSSSECVKLRKKKDIQIERVSLLIWIFRFSARRWHGNCVLTAPLLRNELEMECMRRLLEKIFNSSLFFACARRRESWDFPCDYFKESLWAHYSFVNWVFEREFQWLKSRCFQISEESEETFTSKRLWLIWLTKNWIMIGRFVSKRPLM